MAIIAKFTRTLPAPSATISGGFVFLLSAGWFTQANTGAAGSPIDGGTNSIANGGGDMQIFSDTATTTRLPIEVVSFVTGGGPVAQVWVRVPSYTAGDTITIGKDDTQTVQPAVGAAFGRNAAWVDFVCNFHFNSLDELADSTGNYSLNKNGTITQVTGKIGDASDSALNSNNYYNVVGYSGELGSSARTIKMWFKTSAGNTGLLDYGTNALGQRYTVYIANGGNLRTELNGSFSQSSSAYNDGAFHCFLSKEDGSTTFPASHSSVIDGVDITATDSQGGNVTLNSGNNGDVVFRTDRNAGNTLGNSIYDEYSVRGFKTTSATDSSEYTNQNDPDNFGTSSEYVLVGGGGSTWALQFDGVNDHSLLGAAISISTTDDFSLRWRWPADANSGNHRVLGGINLAASSPRVILFSGGNAVLYGDAGTNKSFPASIDTSVDRVVEFRRASGQLGLYYDNVLQGAAQASTQSFTSFSTLGGNFGTSTIASKLQTLEIDVAGSPVIALDATASSHASGTPILTDTIGANNATGVNMPTDGSAWIDLGGGGENNVSSAFNLSALSFAAVIDNPSTGNNVSSAFNLSALSFAAVLDNTPIENNVSSAFNLSPLSFAAVIDNTSTGNSVSSAFNLSPLSFSAVLDNTPIENSVSSAFNLSPLSFAAVIDNSAAGNSVSSAFSLSALQFASVIDNTPIENSVSSAFNLSPLSFAVRVQNGELVAIVIETNSIVQSNYSRTIIQPTYSTNIKGK